MKYLYKQPEKSGLQTGLAAFGITDCHFRKLRPGKGNTTKKDHHHTGFELHILTGGSQVYQVGPAEHRVENGMFLLIGPGVSHRVTGMEGNTQKYGISFSFFSDAAVDCFAGQISPRMADRLRFIEEEAVQRREISAVLIENALLEIIVGVLRLAGFGEKPAAERSEESLTLSLAKAYIRDNIRRALTVPDVAAYCHLSPKQLTRIFLKGEGLSPGGFIRAERIRCIEKLLSDDSLTLKEISEEMDFSSEYYFNAYFRKNAGMPPGEYRKMLGK